MNIYRQYSSLIRQFRKKRMKKFLKFMAPKEDEIILDVGGTSYNWKLIDINNQVVLLNLKPPTKKPDRKDKDTNLSYVTGDATKMKYAESEFDICFSNSVIEHVGSIEKQKQFAKEVMRVGKKMWIQTPAKTFFFEPHYLTVYLHWLPKKYQKRLIRYFSMWGILSKPNQLKINDLVNRTRLLTYKELIVIFPNCSIIKERFMFMTKAYIIIK